MDPYSVLGIRKNASINEIELAYKGRRSQYHPDRYATEGADTVAWATAQMQEVNEAYALLTNPQARATAERARDAPDPPKAQPSHSRRPRAVSPDIREYLLRNLHGPLDEGHTFVAPDIPYKKLHAALGSYGDGLKPDDVVLLVDDTVFGSAKDGMLVSRTEVRIKEMFQEPVRFPFSKIQKIHSGGNRLNINGHQVLKFTMPDTGEMACVMAGLNDFLIATRACEEAELDESEQDDVEDDNENDAPGSEPEEGVIHEYQRDLLRMRSAGENAVQKALLDLFDWVIRATGAIRQHFDQEDYELEDEERFVLSSDVFRFELLPLVVSYAYNTMLLEIGEDQSKKVFALLADGLIVEVVMRKEGLVDFRRLPEMEKAKRLLAQSRLLKPFMNRMVEYQNALASDEDVSALFLENLQDPMIGRLYDLRSREIVKTMIADVVDSLLDEEDAEEALEEVERCIEFAVQTYIGAVYE